MSDKNHGATGNPETFSEPTLKSVGGGLNSGGTVETNQITINRVTAERAPCVFQSEHTT